jgi:hypothetical protein
MAKNQSAKNNDQPAARKKLRSCGYPLLALPAAVEAAKALCDGLGEGPHSRQSLARGLGYSSFSGAASSKIGSLVHFGLLSRAGGMYSVTAMAKEVFSYPEEGSLVAVEKSAARPDLYKKLIARFLDQPLPEKLAAILSVDYGITGKAAPLAAQNFIETMEFAGLIRDGKLVFPEPEAEAVPREKQINEPKKEADKAAVPAIKIKLPSGIEISFPETLSYRLSLGDFADELKNLEKKISGLNN